MLAQEYHDKVDYFTSLLGTKQVSLDQAVKWGYNTLEVNCENLRKAFIYLNTLSRYVPGSSNTLTDDQAEFILTQLQKLLPC